MATSNTPEQKRALDRAQIMAASALITCQTQDVPFEVALTKVRTIFDALVRRGVKPIEFAIFLTEVSSLAFATIRADAARQAKATQRA
jgi:hypothetical protein